MPRKPAEFSLPYKHCVRAREDLAETVDAAVFPTACTRDWDLT